MSFKSLIQEMRGELGSISRKGFDVRFGYGRSRSQRVVQDTCVPVDAFKQSCWASMPPELLRDVLMRIEESEDTWPSRKNVVSCAGVCRNWRDIVKEIVKVPELSSKLTFPISLKQPGPRGSLVQCYIMRNRSNQTYYLYLGLNQAAASNDDGKFLLAAKRFRRPTCTDYIISLNSDDVSRGSNTYIGKLRSNFLGTKFTVYDAQQTNPGAQVTRTRSSRLLSLKQVSPRIPSGNYPVAHISYELNVLGSRGPRRMQCVMDAIPASAVEPGGTAPTQTELLHSSLDNFPSFSFFRSKSIRSESLPSTAQKEGLLVLKNKAPRWHEQLQCWCLNFNGRVTVASVKNFQLVAAPENGPAGPEHENVILQFGKVGKDVFTMDYQYPISAFQAFTICLSSFDTKIACE
ncbi:hypothetical protein EUTSA_v10001474mg [Eutrema salsugineum]|uniref:Tubby C-terminal domain-containing protein n=1 Tax=Eutrema salsugineum TaxID=72664 RepID=V4L6X7_EUTSA|nr:tubby-like F-box protein 3 isoform X1 [Eutrema salsugineum]ESQ39439.1 hypothetical protein EUTSA_v10001474mg [Eutrema salsugineum]